MSARCMLATALVSCACATSAGAQIIGAAYCGSDVYNDKPPLEGANVVERMHPLVSRARYAEAVRNGEWELALRGIRSDAMQAFVAASVPADDERRFLAQLDSVIDVIPRLPNADNPQRARFVADSVRSIRFQPVQGDRAYRLFRRADTVSVARMNTDQTKAVCWSAMSADAVLFRLQKPLELESLARLARLTTSWANYRTYGYTRQPLELLLFHGSVHDSLPPKRQWLLGHLSLGAELRGRWSDSLTSSNATVVEVGGIWYRRNYTQYSGVSAIASLSGRSSIGYGVMVHAARSLRGGVLLHPGKGKTTRSIVVSTDLYGLLERSKRSVDEGLAVARGIVVLPQPRP